MAWLIVVICVINIVLWVIFLIRFKKLFSTDKIIENTREQINKLVADIDKTTKRDLFLSNEQTKKIQSMLDDADEKMKMFKEATQRLREMIAEADKINHMPTSKSPIYQNIPEVPASKSVKNTQRKKNIDAYVQNSNSGKNIDPENVYEVVKSQEQDLFAETENSKPVKNSEITVTQDGAAYKEVPLIITKIYEEEPVESPLEKKRNLPKRVKELFNEGYSVEEIANQLSCSRTEVELIIEMI